MPHRAIAVACLVVGSFVASAAQAELLDDIKSRGTLVCGVLGNLEPFGYQDPKTRETAGYEIDLCRDLAKDLGVKAELKVVSSQARIPELLEGRLDVLAALISYSPERAEQVAFSDAYVADTFNAVVKKNSNIKKLDDLVAARISVLKGSFLEPLTQKRFPKSTVLSFEDAPTAFTALLQDRVGATVQRATQVRALQIRLGDNDPTAIIEEPLTAQKSAFATRKDNPKFVERMNAFLVEYEASGRGQALFDKWIGANSKFKLTRHFKFGEPIAD